jgi:flavin reductase (DIM6/NTAB) family NADH-FMN oxidoreductase RutF
MLEPVTDDAHLRRAFGCFPSGVTAVCTEIDGGPVGLVASSFTTVSLRPPLVAINLRHESTTWPLLRTGRRLGLSVLAEGQEDVCRRLAGAAEDRFRGTTWLATQDGSVVVDGAALWMDCSVHGEMPAGDHDVVLLLVHAVDSRPDVAPLIFHRSRFRRLEPAAPE